MRTAEVEPTAEREVREPRRPVDKAVGRHGGAERGDRRRGRRWRVGQLEGVAMGGVHKGEEVGVPGAERGAEVHGKAEVWGEVGNLGHREAPVRGQEEETVNLGRKAGRERGAAERGKVGGKRPRGRGERDGEGGESGGERVGGGRLEEPEEGGVAEDEGEQRAMARETEKATAAAEDAEREEAARLGEEERE